jgi:pyridoxal phosphate enzyme (YggS family)
MDRVAKAAHRAGRVASDVTVVAVSKYTGTDEVRELIQLGHQDFGENHVQQLMQRTAVIDEWRQRSQRLGLRDAPGRATPRGGNHASGAHAAAGASLLPEVRWHMIGHLQRNKARKAAELSSLIHSVDSLRLAEELQAIGLRIGRPVDILLQVNTSGEESKFGCAPAAAKHLAEMIDSMANLRLRGLMTMAPYSEDPEQSRPCFARLREAFDEIAKLGIGRTGLSPQSPSTFNVLSMGMSGDFEVAIEEGSTLVRIGSAIFGDRPGDAAGADGSGDPSDRA